ncbi:SDR family oxidoreductase [Flavobacterium subsaxonicum]|uniref:Short-chain dehydrogenase n=1 Tax=Flavobacterium subsaxonicum WB 4.1-42 = DSM 21790 TaxID=1121898 RepID=A0A0A2MNR9_9FLAO|nr:SDR family oxidoreductase [Flavobacterium subsaxonicum]KGO94327.1 short-chain dehydrogenase [Flavobacterium subsaxonicum WB 4.1-42 = DSM 21790]
MSKPTEIPAQKQQSQPGDEYKMNPEPEIIRAGYKGSDKLKGKIALITGGDSGIGRSAAVHFAREGAHVAIVYYDEHKDAEATKALVEKEGQKCLLISGDLKDEAFCQSAVAQTVKELGRLNILVNNAAVQFPQTDFKDITGSQVRETFETNILPFFYVTREALKHLQKGDSIINTTSVTAYRGSEHLIDYSSTKGAIVSFTRSTSAMLAEKGIRVNGVAPGPIWTPLIPSSFRPEDVAKFGQDVPLKRPGQPSEVGPAYVFLASEDASYITGQVLHVNGGEMTGG